MYLLVKTRKWSFACYYPDKIKKGYNVLNSVSDTDRAFAFASKQMAEFKHSSVTITETMEINTVYDNCLFSELHPACRGVRHACAAGPAHPYECQVPLGSTS